MDTQLGNKKKLSEEHSSFVLVVLVFGLFLSLSACTPYQLRLIKENLRDKVPNVEIQKKPSSLGIQIVPATRVAIIGMIPKTPHSVEAGSDRSLEATHWFLDGVDSALIGDSFHYVAQSEFRGNQVVEKSSDQESDLIRENQLDLLVRFELPGLSKEGFPERTYQKVEALVKDGDQIIATFSMFLTLFALEPQRSIPASWVVDAEKKPVRIPGKKLDRQVYFKEVGRLVAKNLVVLLSNATLHSEEKKISYVDLEARRMFEAGFPSLIPEN